MDSGFAKVGGLRRARIASLIYSWGMGAEPPAAPVGSWEPQIPNQELPLKLKAFFHFYTEYGPKVKEVPKKNCLVNDESSSWALPLPFQ